MLKKANFFLFLLGVYLFSTGISYAYFDFLGPKLADFQSPAPALTGAPEEPGLPILTGPKDQECPINGGMFTKIEKELWGKRRPLLVMIENHEDSRPQSGLSRADVVYEAVAEGGVTRLMGVFYCGNAAYAIKDKYDVGPVRSARTYFVDWASEYADVPLYAHVGGAGNCDDPTVATPAKALCQIGKYSWRDKNTWGDMDQFALSFRVCRREPDRLGHEVATEHTMFCSSEALWSTAESRKLTNVNYLDKSWDENFRSWKFKDDSPSSGSVSPSMSFWSGYPVYDVKWEYNSQDNSYKRLNGLSPHLDFNNKKQLTAKNVVVQFAQEKGPLDEHKHLVYTTVANRGRALIFQDGKVIEGSWTKNSRTGRTIFYNSSGAEIKFNRGPIWIEVVPLSGKVTY